MSEYGINLDNKAVNELKEAVGGGGTTVIANEELTGDEETLTELTVDGTKYKVPQGSGAPKYKHHIIFALSDFETCFLYAVEFDIVNNDANTHYSRTYDDIVNMVGASPDFTLPCTLYGGGSAYPAFMIYDSCYGDHPLVFRALIGINYDEESYAPISPEYDTYSPEKSTFLFISETVQDN